MSTMVNGTPTTPASDVSSPTGSMPGVAKQSTKGPTNAANKPTDNGRKQSGTPADGAQRRSGPPKAWQSGMNPITHRSNNVNQQNGASQQPKMGQKSTGGQDVSLAEKSAHERLLFLLGNFMGQNASVTIRNGDVFTGIFFGANVDNQEVVYLLKMVQQTKSADKNEGVNGVRDTVQDYVGSGDDYTMTFEGKDVVNLAVDGVSFLTSEKQANGSATGFRTDTDISGNLAVRERELQRWSAPGDDDDVNMSLEDSNGASWDQFKANEKLFGLKSDYDESVYTTALDRTTPQYRQNEAKAQRIAREIEGNTSNNPHVREERGIVDDSGELDEEEKYSGVRRTVADYPPLQSTQPNRYMPPARRPPSGQPTVAGAPVDPAIISSQIAKPETSPQLKQEQVQIPVTNAATATKAPEPASKEVKKEAPKEPPTKAPNATANVETEVLDSFRTFAEKQKTKVADDRQKRVRHEKDIKLNDLKGFSKNFKLHTPVPNDLVPILAKDKKKQDEIMEKARREAEEHSRSPPKAQKPADDIPTRPTGDARRDAGRGASGASERIDLTGHRQQFPPRGPQGGTSLRDRAHQGPYPFPTSPQGNPGYLSHRLAETQRAHKAGIPIAIPTPLPIQGQKPPSRPSGSAAHVAGSQASSAVRTPTSATSTKFNVQAIEFKPNPAANAFKPTTASGNSSSPRGKHVRGTPPVASPSDFWGSKKPRPASERPSIADQFNPLKRLKEKAAKEGKAKDYAANGGIVYAHATPVTWSAPKDDEEVKSYKDMFNETPAATTGTSPQPNAVSPMNANQAHLHQLPAHLQPQGTPQGHNPQHSPFPIPPQQHLYPGAPNGPHQFEDHRIHGSPSGASYPAHRVPANVFSYPTAMSPAVQYPYGQPVPPHMMTPGGPQPQTFRQYPNGPQYMSSPAPQLAAPMMMQQGSQGSYMGPQGMGVPHIPVYGPAPNPPYNGPSQPPSGYPSPGRGAPMMMHQGSYQGQTPSMHPVAGQYGQPFYAQQQPPHMNSARGYPSPQPHYNHSPQQQFHYPPQPSRMSSHGYGNHPQGAPQAMPVQQGHPPGAALENGDNMK